MVFSDEIQGFWLGEEVQPLLALYILQTRLLFDSASTDGVPIHLTELGEGEHLRPAASILRRHVRRDDFCRSR